MLFLTAGVILWSHCRRSPVASPQPEPPVAGLNSIAFLEQPRLSTSDKVFYNTAGRYSFVYLPDHKQSQWVAYKLTKTDTGSTDRADSFKVDPMIGAYGWTCAVDSDYRNSGYDRGHLVPSADRTCDEAANRATFLFSNIAPQLHKLNGGIWKSLEEELRKRTAQYDTLYIVTGGVLQKERTYPFIGAGVSVPELFYKVVAMRKGNLFETEAYVMPNASENNGAYRAHQVTLDSVGRLTGLQFFPLISTIQSP